jgi:hypothetical protein
MGMLKFSSCATCLNMMMDLKQKRIQLKVIFL